MDGNLLPSGMAAQALGQEPQAALPQEGGDADQPQEDARAGAGLILESIIQQGKALLPWLLFVSEQSERA